MKKIAKIIAFLPISASMRGRIYQLLACKNSKIGNGFRIGLGSYIDAEKIQIGKNVTVGNMVRIKLLDSFQVGDGTSIGSSTIICRFVTS